MLFRKLAAWYSTQLTRSPLATQMVTAGSIAGCGDLLAQQLQRDWWQLQGTEQPAAHEASIDWRRTLAFVSFGALYTGGIQSVLFRFYAKQWPLALATESYWSRARPVLARLFCNQFVVVPALYFPLFFGVTETLRGRTPVQAKAHYDSRWWKACQLNYCLWLPAQAVQFALVPVQLQVLFVSGVGLFWQTSLSIAANYGKSGGE